MKSPVVSMKSMATPERTPVSRITCKGREAEPGIGVAEAFNTWGGSKNAIGKL